MKVITHSPFIKTLFSQPQDRKLLSIYFVAGYPDIDSTGEIIRQLQDSGVDLIEVGIPFSDPLADGPVIQDSSMQALKNGMSLEKLFAQLEDVEVKVPILLMGYLNPILQFGIEHFCNRCKSTGVSGAIIPDLPMEVYLNEYASFFDDNDLSMIFMITPQTSEARVRLIDASTTSFIYAVTSASTTGNKNVNTDTTNYLSRIANLKLKHPIMTGFNIHDRASFESACQHTRGGIIGSAFIRHIAANHDFNNSIPEFIKNIRP